MVLLCIKATVFQLYLKLQYNQFVYDKKSVDSIGM